MTWTLLNKDNLLAVDAFIDFYNAKQIITGSPKRMTREIVARLHIKAGFEILVYKETKYRAAILVKDFQPDPSMVSIIEVCIHSTDDDWTDCSVCENKLDTYSLIDKQTFAQAVAEGLVLIMNKIKPRKIRNENLKKTPAGKYIGELVKVLEPTLLWEYFADYWLLSIPEEI